MRWRKSMIDGSYGDKTVIITTGIVDRPNRAVLLFHGVHSSSSSDPGNKYAYIGSRLAANGVLPILVETSRRVRNRSDFQEDPMGWIMGAFEGKTFEEELSDCNSALIATASLYQTLPTTLWGFSLGGLSALLLAGGYLGKVPPQVDSLIVCGSGDSVYQQNMFMFNLPILNTLGDDLTILAKSARNLNLKWARAFRGSKDETFPQEACRHLFDAMSVEDKEYYEIEGSDHSFRFLNGQASRRPLKEVFRKLPQLFPFL